MSAATATAQREPLYFEDLAVGRRFRSGDAMMTAEAMKRYAAEFDPQPFHLDEQAAMGTFFDGLAASGWHTAGVTMRLTVETLSIAGGLIGAGTEELRWPKPTRAGDRLHLDIEVLEARTSRSRPEIGLVKVRTTTLNQADEAVQHLVVTIVVPRRGAKETHGG